MYTAYIKKILRDLIHDHKLCRQTVSDLLLTIDDLEEVGMTLDPETGDYYVDRKGTE